MPLVKKANAHHHGALREALLAEAERVIDTDGLDAISKAVEFTRAAPANHFGDLPRLLSDLAADGLRRLTARPSVAVEEAGTGSHDRPSSKLSTHEKRITSCIALSPAPSPPLPLPRC